jgi:hypothetical protein
MNIYPNFVASGLISSISLPNITHAEFFLSQKHFKNVFYVFQVLL